MQMILPLVMFFILEDHAIRLTFLFERGIFMIESTLLKKFVVGKNGVGARGHILTLKVGARESYLSFWV